MPRVAVVGNLARDVVDGGAVTAGGCPAFAGEAFRRLDARGQIVTRCAEDDRRVLAPAVGAPSADVVFLGARATSGFALDYAGEERAMRVTAIGEQWRPEDAAALADDVTWVHAAPLVRGDFPAETLAALARGRSLSLDAQGLVRADTLGPLELDARFDPRALEHVSVLKLSEEEARVLGGGRFGGDDARRTGVPEVVLTRGAGGATVFADGAATDIPAAGRVAGVQTTGAGDVFAVAYAIRRADGADPVAAAARAAAVVADVLRERATGP
jgi:sugar/nucleoside kinase (ribokinase family)